MTGIIRSSRITHGRGSADLQVIQRLAPVGDAVHLVALVLQHFAAANRGCRDHRRRPGCRRTAPRVAHVDGDLSGCRLALSNCLRHLEHEPADAGGIRDARVKLAAPSPSCVARRLRLPARAGRGRTRWKRARCSAPATESNPNITYLTVNGWNARLDLYLPLHATAPAADVRLLPRRRLGDRHRRTRSALEVLPYLAMGFAVVNVDYRLAQVAPAPAAAEDARCALRWVFRHAQQYNLDPARVVAGGMSAGGHLALLAAMAPASAGLDRLCPGNETSQGRGDRELLRHRRRARRAGRRARARLRHRVVRSRAGRERLARALSPHRVRARKGPRVITVHGDADPVVPFEHARRLTAALAAAGVPNKLVLVHGGKHGDFGGYDMVRATHAVHEFLLKRGLIADRARLSAKARTSVLAAASQTPPGFGVGRRSPRVRSRCSLRGPPPAPPAPSAGSASARAAGSRPPAPAARPPCARTR